MPGPEGVTDGSPRRGSRRPGGAGRRRSGDSRTIALSDGLVKPQTTRCSGRGRQRSATCCGTGVRGAGSGRRLAGRSGGPIIHRRRRLVHARSQVVHTRRRGCPRIVQTERAFGGRPRRGRTRRPSPRRTGGDHAVGEWRPRRARPRRGLPRRHRSRAWPTTSEHDDIRTTLQRSSTTPAGWWPARSAPCGGIAGRQPAGGRSGLSGGALNERIAGHEAAIRSTGRGSAGPRPAWPGAGCRARARAWCGCGAAGDRDLGAGHGARDERRRFSAPAASRTRVRTPRARRSRGSSPLRPPGSISSDQSPL